MFKGKKEPIPAVRISSGSTVLNGETVYTVDEVVLMEKRELSHTSRGHSYRGHIKLTRAEAVEMLAALQTALLENKSVNWK